MKYARPVRGFTLIETIVYLGLFAIVMGGFIVSAFYILDSGNNTSDLIAVQEEGTFLNRKLSWAIGSAIDADVTGGTALTLTRADLPSSQNPLTITLDESGPRGRLMLERGSEGALPLSSDAFDIGNVTFTVRNEVGRPTYVGVTFTVDEEPFRLDIYLRQ